MSKTRKKLISIALAILTVSAISATAFAFDINPHYDVGPYDTEQVTQFVPGSTKIYLNTRPYNGGEVTISLSGAASGSALFPYYTSRPNWEVTGVNSSGTLYVDAIAGASGTAGYLHIWS